ncbi:hypothetical protein NPIL_675001, partial [Nephila pilipes]
NRRSRSDPKIRNNPILSRSDPHKTKSNLTINQQP